MNLTTLDYWSELDVARLRRCHVQQSRAVNETEMIKGHKLNQGIK